MNKSLLIGALLATTGLFGQTLVSTTPQNKKVVLEEFTGINCVFCPDGHAIAQAIKDQNPEDIFLVNIHAGGFANPGNGQPDFRTSFGEAIADQSGLDGYPAGTVNRHVFSGRKTALNRGQWASAADQILQESSYVNVAGTAEIDISTNELIVNVEVYYTGDSPESTNKLNVALLQDNTAGPQTGGNSGNNYVHMHRLVHFLTEQWGEDITTTSEGSFSEHSFTYELPEDYRNVDVVLEDLKLVVYVAEGQQEIVTGDGIKPSFINVPGNDVAIKSIIDILPTCLDRITPEVKIQNRGGDTLTSLDITYSVNDETPQTYTWTGSLDTFDSETIQLDEISFTPNNIENTLEVNLASDDNLTNNTMSTTFYPSVEGTENVRMQINSAGHGSTTTWEAKNINNDVIASGGPYNNNSQEVVEFTLPEDCYEFTVYDSSQQGTSTITVVDGNGTQLFRTPRNFGANIKGNFRTNALLDVTDVALESIALYPNPTNGIVNIANAEGFQMDVYDVLGKVIVSKNSISNQEMVDLTNLAAGVYYIKLKNEKSSTVKKVVVK